MTAFEALDGYSNYETFLAARWVKELHKPTWEDVRHPRQYASRLEGALHDSLPKVDGIACGLMGAAYGRIDWTEISERSIEENWTEIAQQHVKEIAVQRAKVRSGQ
jgi:hypothetical protein